MAKSDKPLSKLDAFIGQAIGNDRTIGLPDDPAATAYPTLWDWLTRVTAGKDYIKQPARISVVLGPDGVLITLSDTDLTLSLDTSASHLDDVWRTLDAVLSGPNPPFKIWGKKQPTLRKRKT